MTIIEQIKAEIERLIEESDFDESANLYSLLSFLSTLESEKPINQSARQRLAEWSKTPEGRESYEKVASEMRMELALDEEVKNYFKGWVDEDTDSVHNGCAINDSNQYVSICDCARIARHFANWQKEQYHFFNEAWADKMQYQLDRNYENGKQAMKEQMMKEAVEGEVVQDLKGVNRVKSFSKIPEWLHFGDKVRIIIIKEDEK